MSDIAQLGFAVDTNGLVKGAKALDSFAVAGKKTEKSVDTSSKKIIDDYREVEKTVGKTAASMVKAERDVAKAQKESEKQLRKRSRGLGQASIQFQQFIGQIQGGQGVLLALSQQGADLGIVLDKALLGSIIGISASLVGLLLPSLLKTTDATELLEDVNKDLGASLEESAAGADVLSKSLLKLAEKSEALAKLQISSSIEDAEKLISISATGIEQALDDAFGSTTESVLRGFSAELREAATKTTGSMEDIIEALSSGTSAGFAFSGGAAGIADTVRLISNQFKITKKQAVELALSISDVFEDQSIFNIKKFENNLADLNVMVGGSNKEINKLSKTLIPLFDATTEGVDKVNILRKAFGDFGASAAESDKDLIKFNEDVASVSASLEAQIIALRDGEDAAINWSIAQRLGLDSTEAIPEAIQAQVAQLKALKAERESDLALMKEIDQAEKLFAADDKKDKSDAEKRRKKEARDFEKLTKDVEDFGGTWSKTGSIVVDAFGDMSDALNDYMKQIKGLDDLQERINEARKEDGADIVALNLLQEKVNGDRVLAELGGIKALSSASGSLFEEKTAAAKAFAALNKIITVAEIALSFQKMAAGTTEAGVHVVNETTKQGANALTAITSAFAAPFPVNFVAGAAMIGIMASLLGGAFSGGGGDSGNGTGSDSTIKGGGVSESLSKANENLEDIMIDQLAELRGLRSDITNVQNLSFGLLSDLLNVDAGHSEIKNATERDLERSIEGLNRGVRGGTFTSELRGIFDGIGEAIDESVDILGLNTSRTLENFVFRIGTISFDELSAEEAGERLDQILSSQSDLMVESIAPFITQYQKLGEGALETLVRVAKEQAVFNDAIDMFGISISEVSKLMQIDMAQSLIELTGGFEKFSELSTSFIDNFFTDAERFSFLEKSLTEAFDTLGLSVVDSRKEFKALVQGIDVTTEQGQELLATLLEINPALSDYIDELERVENARVDMTIKLLRLQGKAEEALAKERELELAALDESLRALQLLIFAEEDRIALINEQEKALRQQQEVARDSFSMLERSIDLEKQRAQAILDTASTAHITELDRIEGLRSVLEAENTLRQGNLVAAENALNEAFNSEMRRIQEGANTEISLIQEITNTRVAALNDEKSAINATVSSMRSLVSTINSSLGLSGSTNLLAALTSARSGDFSKAGALNVQALTTLDPSSFSSAEDLAVQQAINQNRLKEIGDLAGSQLSEAEAMLAAIDLQVAATKLGSEKQIASIQELTQNQIVGLQEQLNSLLGIDTRILSVDKAIEQFQKSQQALDTLNYIKELAKLDMLIESANDVFALHEQAYQDELLRLDKMLDDNEALLNIALGIDNSILSVAEAVSELNIAIQNIPPPVVVVNTPPPPVSTPAQEDLLTAMQELVAGNKEVVKNTKTTARFSKAGVLFGEGIAP